MAFTSQGCFSPLAASLGGIVGQEVLKALTGKYSPLKQWVCTCMRIKNYNNDNIPYKIYKNLHITELALVRLLILHLLLQFIRPICILQHHYFLSQTFDNQEVLCTLFY